MYCLIFVLFFCSFVFISGGTLGLDTQIRLEVTRSILAGKGFTAGELGRVQWTQADGTPRRYSVYGIGQSLLLLPFEFVLGNAMSFFAPAEKAGELTDKAIALTCFPACGAACIVLLFALSRELGASRRSSARLALIVGFCSPIFVYGPDSQETSQVLAIELAGLLLCYRGIARARPGFFVAGLCCLWTTTIFRPNCAVDAAVLSALVLAGAHRSRRTGMLRRGFFALICCAGLAVCWYLLYNKLRFGSAFTNAYVLLFRQRQMDAFSAPFWRGFLGPFFSVDKSIFLYSLLTLPAIVISSRGPLAKSPAHAM